MSCRIKLGLITAIAALLPFFFGCSPQNDLQDALSTNRIISGSVGRDIERRLAPELQKLMDELALPGLAVGVVLDQRIVYAQGFGVTESGSGEPVTPLTIFHMASVSKPFVATAVMQLAETGRVNLDEPVTTYLPYFCVSNEEAAVTVRQMLSHTAGLPNVEDYEWYAPTYDDQALERYVRELAGVALIHPPGSQFDYSNMAYDCLGDVIAKASGMTFEDYMQENVLSAAGMRNSSYLMPDEGELPSYWAAPHLRGLVAFPWDGYPYNRTHAPSSTLHSNVVDMCQWAIANLARGEGEHRILEPSSYDTFWTPIAAAGRGDFGQDIALGWFLGEYCGRQLIGHTGSDTGFRSSFYMVPEETLAIVLLCNDYSAPLLSLTALVLDAALGGELPTVMIPALHRVGATMIQEGYDKALAEWRELMEAEPERYSFGADQFFNYGEVALDAGRVEDVEGIARLAMDVLAEPELEMLHQAAAGYLAEHPDNSAALAATELLRSR
jgi:CubicO group peptidase (beta-lactamase class C family)